jgi:Fe-S-cluster containining protein
MPVEVRLADLERLGLLGKGEASPKKIARRLGREGIVRSYRGATGLFQLEPQGDGSCPFLGPDRLCTVYEKRPDLCRDFPLKAGPRPGFCPFNRKENGRVP